MYFLFLNFALIFFSIPILSMQCKLRGMAGTHQKEVCDFCDKFKVNYLLQETQSTIFKNQNRILFHGSPGNGKTTYAEVLARLMNRNLVSINAGEIVSAYPGQGGAKIASLIEDAKKKAVESGNKVLIFIDEIESLTSYIEDSHRSEHRSAAARLWTLLDKYNTDFDVVFVFSTNSIKNISETFLSRFIGTNILLISNPDEFQIKDLIRSVFLSERLTINLLTLHDIVKRMNRNYLENLSNYIDSLICNLKNINKCEQDSKKILNGNHLIKELENLKKMINEVEKTEFLEQKISLFNELITKTYEIFYQAKEFCDIQSTDQTISKEHAIQIKNMFGLLKIVIMIEGEIEGECSSNELNSKLSDLMNGINYSNQTAFERNSKSVALVLEFYDLLNKFHEQVKKYIDSQMRLPNDLVLNEIAKMCDGLSRRAIVNLQAQILELNVKNYQILNDEKLKTLKEAIEKAKKTYKNWDKNEHEEAQRLLTRLELIKLYSQIECREKHDIKCKSEILDALNYNALRKQLHDLINKGKK